MRVVVELYAGLRKHLDNHEKIEVEVAEGTTIGELVASFGVAQTEARNAAIDGQIVYPDDPVVDGCEVMVIPPIAGG